MSPTRRVPRDLADTVALRAATRAREEIISALGPLAAKPLDEEASERMRLALNRADSPEVRRAIRCVNGPTDTRPTLTVVPTHPSTDPIEKGGDAA